MADAPSKPPALKRPTVRFPIPKSARVFEHDPSSITLSPITLAEELDAHQVIASQGRGVAALNIELAKRSVVAVDDKPVDWSTGQPEWFERASPKVRDLAILAFGRVNRPTQKEEDDFLAGADSKPA